MRDAPIFGKAAFCALFNGVDWAGGWDAEGRDIPPWLQLKDDGIYIVPPPEGMCTITTAELETVYLHKGALAGPVLVLEFPFSVNSFVEFMDKFHLDYECDAVVLEAIGEEYYTVEGVAKRLMIEREDVFTLIQNREISPSVYLVEPVNVVAINDGGNHIKIVGLFEFEGLRGLQWTGFKVIGVNFFTKEMSYEDVGVIDDAFKNSYKQFLSIKEFCGSKDVQNHSFLKSQVVVSHKALREYVKSSKAIIRYVEEPLQQQETNGNMPNIPENNQQQPNTEKKKRDKRSLLKNGIKRICVESTKKTKKFPSSKDVIAAIDAEAKKDEEFGKLVNFADTKDGISLCDEDNPLSFKTLKNWLSDEIKPEVLKDLNMQSSMRKSRKKSPSLTVPKNPGL
jgi:hypothetical protein